MRRAGTPADVTEGMRAGFLNASPQVAAAFGIETDDPAALCLAVLGAKGKAQGLRQSQDTLQVPPDFNLGKEVYLVEHQDHLKSAGLRVELRTSNAMT